MSMCVAVFDSVFDGHACRALHAAASARGLGHALYVREDSPQTALEHAMESFLEGVGDEAPYVEYWSRQEW